MKKDVKNYPGIQELIEEGLIAAKLKHIMTEIKTSRAKNKDIRKTFFVVTPEIKHEGENNIKDINLLLKE